MRDSCYLKMINYSEYYQKYAQALFIVKPVMKPNFDTILQIKLSVL